MAQGLADRRGLEPRNSACFGQCGATGYVGSGVQVGKQKILIVSFSSFRDLYDDNPRNLRPCPSNQSGTQTPKTHHYVTVPLSIPILLDSTTKPNQLYITCPGTYTKRLNDLISFNTRV